MNKLSVFENAPDILPLSMRDKKSVVQVIKAMGKTSFEARNVYRAFTLYSNMINDNDTIWLGIAGAGIAGGMGGMVIDLIQNGFIDVICSTGAQVYHDLHFAFGLPVKAIHPVTDDDLLRQHGDTRIYDIGIREKETLQAQDELIRAFVKERYACLKKTPLSSWELNQQLGLWTLETAPYPQRSVVAIAAKQGVPVFWDSLANHSISMNLARTDCEGYPLQLSAQKDIMDAAAITYRSNRTGFIELGGGGPKNFIQQTGPTIDQILGIEFKGADRGLQISTAAEREGSLSGCTFSESVTWGKYKSADQDKLIQVWAEYSLVLPFLTAAMLSACKAKAAKNLIKVLPHWSEQFLQLAKTTVEDKGEKE